MLLRAAFSKTDKIARKILAYEGMLCLAGALLKGIQFDYRKVASTSLSLLQALADNLTSSCLCF